MDNNNKKTMIALSIDLKNTLEIKWQMMMKILKCQNKGLPEALQTDWNKMKMFQECPTNLGLQTDWNKMKMFQECPTDLGLQTGLEQNEDVPRLSHNFRSSNGLEQNEDVPRVSHNFRSSNGNNEDMFTRSYSPLRKSSHSKQGGSGTRMLSKDEQGKEKNSNEISARQFDVNDD